MNNIATPNKMMAHISMQTKTFLFIQRPLSGRSDLPINIILNNGLILTYTPPHNKVNILLL